MRGKPSDGMGEERRKKPLPGKATLNADAQTPAGLAGGFRGSAMTLP
jgi:hypothetical protein